MICWEAEGKEKFFLLHLPKEEKSYLEEFFSHEEVKNCRQTEFLSALNKKLVL